MPDSDTRRSGTTSVLRRAAALVAVGLTCALAACSSTASTTASNTETKNLEVMSWWTSGSERAALNVLLSDFSTAHPGVTVTNGAVAGGGGSNVQVVLATRLLAGNPPDVWQTFPGASIHQYIDSGRIADVSSVYAQDGLTSVIPKRILQAVSQDGKQYGVPTGAHRSNMLFFSSTALAKAGISAPAAGYTSAQLLTDLAKAKSAGITPLCLGAKDAFTTNELFENILLSVIGTAGWNELTADRLNWNGAPVRQALSQFASVLTYADPAGAALTWDQATKKLGAGGCAFETINDSAYGELRTDGFTEGTDFGVVPYPGTQSQFLAVVDSFVVASGATDARNSRAFLATIGSKETQLAFNKLKGSVPIRNDVDVSSLPAYQRTSANAFTHDQILLSIVHGEAMSPRFQQGFYDAVASFARSKDVNAFHQTLQDAVSRDQAAPPH